MFALLSRRWPALAAVALAATVPLSAQPAVHGTVLDPAQRPIAGAQVELLRVPGNFEAGKLRLEGRDPEPVAIGKTGAEGRFLLRAPGFGVFKVVVRGDGRVPVQHAPFPLVEDEELSPVVLSPDAGARLRVTDASGRPLAGIPVFAETSSVRRSEPRTGEDWGIEFRLGRTGADGFVNLPRVAEEKLDVTVFPPGGVEERALAVDSGTIAVQAQRAEPYRVRVLTPEGRPAAGVLVRAGDLSWPAGLTDTEGRLQIPRRPGEPAKLRLVAEDGRRQAAELAASTSPNEEVTVVLADPAVVSGRVTSGAKPLAGALVRAAADPGSFALTAADGQYRLVAPETRFELQAVAPHHLPRAARVNGGHVRSGRGPALELALAVAIRGRVLDSRGAPLAGVALAALPERRPDLAATVIDRAASDADGRFELRRLQTDRGYEVEAALPGYLPVVIQAVAPARSRQVPPLNVVLAPARAAQGRVQDAEGRPVAGAQVLLLPSREPGHSRRLAGDGQEAPTGETGRFSVAQIPANPLDLVVRKPGFAPAFVRGIRVPPGTGTADLGAFTLHPGARLSGLVADRAGRPVPGAEVFRVEDLEHVDAMSTRLASERADAVTTQDGRFVLADLPKGSPVNLLVRARGYLPAGLRGARPPNREPLEVRLETAALLRGVVVDEARQPVANARVAVTVKAERPVLRSAATGPDGRFEVLDAPPGAALVSVLARGFVPIEDLKVTLPRPEPGEMTLTLVRGAVLAGHVTTSDGAAVPRARIYAAGSAAFSDDEGAFSVEGVAMGPAVVEVSHPHYRRITREMVIEPGRNELDVTFEPGVEVVGQVVDEQGAPVSGARVELRSEIRGELTYRGHSATDGTFRLAPVAQGRYRLGAGHAGYSPAELNAPVVVAREPVSGLEIALRRGGAIVGSVLGLKPEELAAVRVEAASGGRAFPAVVDSQGHYEIRHLEPDDYLVRASLVAGQRQVQARVPLASGQGEVTRDLEFTRRLTLSGQVLYGEEPLPEARISVRGQHLAVERSVTTDHLGGFRIEDLEPDTYGLGLNHPREPLVHNETVELAADREIVIELRASEVTGMVLDAESGRPVARALVLLRPLTGPEFLISGGSEQDGTFRFSHVPPGGYQLAVQAKGYAPGEREVTVAAGQDLTGVDLSLAPTRGLALTVHLASGRVPDLVHIRVLGPGGNAVVTETRAPDRSGNLQLSTVPEGEWNLLLSSAGAAVLGLPLTVPGEPRAVTLPEAGRLRVRVPALTTTDLLATLSLQGGDQQPFWTLGVGGLIQDRWQVVAGEVLVEGVPAGLWQVRVEAPDGQIWTGAVATTGKADAGVVLEGADSADQRGRARS